MAATTKASMQGIVNARQTATYALMDTIIRSTAVAIAFGTLMTEKSSKQVLVNQKLGAVKNKSQTTLPPALEALMGAPGLADIGLITESAVQEINSKASSPFLATVQKALCLPNIEGIPISTATITSSREVEVGEQLMIVQSTSAKKYWTDNAVPKLKEWTIDGYITPALAIDAYYIVRPSLLMQITFLDDCASSRRPVLFKDNRGGFRYVQITNLQTKEEASYNNAIKVDITLREYAPFSVNNMQSVVKKATATA